MRHLRIIAAVVTGARPGETRPRSAWEAFWLSAAITVTVLGGSYAAHALWPSAVDAGRTVLSTIFLPTGHQPMAVADGNGVAITWRPNEGIDGRSPAYRISRVSAGGTTQVCVVSATTCRDIGAPAGTWRYTVRPDIGPWQGRESRPGAPVTVTTDPLPPARVGAGPAPQPNAGGTRGPARLRPAVRA